MTAERLDHERRLFTATNRSLGQRTLALARESSEGGQYALSSTSPIPAALTGTPQWSTICASRRSALAGRWCWSTATATTSRSTSPLLSPSGKVLANFTRVETFGSANTHWVSAEVDPQDPNVFTFRPQIVPANAG